MRICLYGKEWNKRKVVPITPLPRIQTVERVMSDIESVRDGSQIEKKSANVFERNDTVDNFGELGVMMRCARLRLMNKLDDPVKKIEAFKTSGYEEE